MSRTPKVSERDLEKAAQLWCLPQHSHKAMDVEFATSIAQALAQERVETIKRCVEALDKCPDMSDITHCNTCHAHMKETVLGLLKKEEASES